MKPRKSQPAPGISANARTVVIVAILAVSVLIGMWMFRRRPTPLAEIQCSDGPRRLIDATQFETQYWAYSVKLEGSLGGKAKAAGAMEPHQLQQLSDALQQGNEFRKWLVNSYNACALTQKQHADYEVEFQSMDGVAQNIQKALDKGVNTVAERSSLAALVNTYIQLARKVQTSTSLPKNNP